MLYKDYVIASIRTHLAMSREALNKMDFERAKYYLTLAKNDKKVLESLQDTTKTMIYKG